MPRTAARRAAALAAVPVAVVTDLVLSAGPAAAHAAGGGSLPAPPWLLSYIGAFAVALTAIALRSTWPVPRLASAGTEVEAPGPGSRVGGALGVGLLAAVLIIAVVGPDDLAANVAPYAVLVIWWVGLPALCLLAGDVVRSINPFVAVVGLLERVGLRSREATDGPTWTAAAFLGAFGWFFLAYHRPGSPRALAVFLVAYALAAVLAGLRWGRGWLATGEGFGALSRGVALISLRRRHAAPPGLLPLMVVWVGGTGFDALSSTSFWQDVVGTSQGWSRTMLSTVGLVWTTAVVAGVVLLVLRLAQPDRSTDEDGQRSAALAAALGVALVPVALTWFLAHDLRYFLFESQNFYALVSDPLGKGWDLFGTIHHTIDYSIVKARWVRWVELGALLVGHVAAVVLAHDAALRLLGRRSGMRATWVVAAMVAASTVGAALLVLA